MNFSNSSFTILGAGKSGIAVAALLRKKGAKVFLSDENEKSKLKFINEDILKKEGIEYEWGTHSGKIFDNDIVIKSPGIPPGNEVIKKAWQLKKKIYSEIEAASWFCKAPILAITGTNGKTTTTVLTGEIFKNAGYDAKVCGNVGIAFSEVLKDLNEDSVVILEVSSFQLNDIEKFKPKVSVLLNITEDHIDWHESFDNYLRAKLNITKNQGEGDLAIINYDDKILWEALKNVNIRKAYFSTKENLKQRADAACYLENENIVYFDKIKKIEEVIMKAGEIKIRGNHNIYNSLAAIISARAFDIKKEIIRDTLMKFPGVEHRIEFIREINGISFYNDSKATNIDSLIVALESFDGNLILILGGRESGNDYSRVNDLVKSRVKEIIAIGESKEKILKHFNKNTRVTLAESLNEAVEQSLERAKEGDIVLLSPGCKSFDMFDNFEHRGKEFKKIVNKLN